MAKTVFGQKCNTEFARVEHCPWAEDHSCRTTQVHFHSCEGAEIGVCKMCDEVGCANRKEPYDSNVISKGE